jgi:copper transport protein
MRRLGIAGATAAAALALPASAWAHAALLHAVPAASGIVNTPPSQVALTYSERVEPRFAIVSVTDASGRQETAGPPHRNATNGDELDVPLKRTPQGWYLVFWRAISVDGHPVRGAFTFAVGPNPGPAPQFVIPPLSETAATTTLVIARWITFLTFMSAIGLFVFRVIVARPLRAPPRALTVAFGIATAVALIAVPIYVLLATAQFALRSAFSVGALVPLMGRSAFGRGYLRLELLVALFAVAASIAILLDRRATPRRSIAELLSLLGALLAAGAVLLAPGAAGHAAQTSPRALALLLDWLHLAAGSLWVGGLIGLILLWVSLPSPERLSGLVLCVPRFSRLALASVLVLIGSGIWASVLHLPTLASLWQTSYGLAIIVKASLLLAAITLASGNILRTVPELRGPEPTMGAAVVLRRLVSGEAILVVGAIAAAAVLSSLAPPSKALAALGTPSARIGPGPASPTVSTHGYRLAFRVSPNRAAVPNDFSVDISRNGSPVRGAEVTARFTMLDMEMGSQEYRLAEVKPGQYAHSAPALVMVGHWGLQFEVAPQGVQPFTVQLLDRAGG